MPELSHHKGDISDLVLPYALVAQMRLILSRPVVDAAELAMERIVGVASPYAATPLAQTVKGRWCVFPEVIGTDSKHFAPDRSRQH